MIEGGTDRAIFEPPTREQATKWVDESWQELPEDVVRNAWKKNGLEYFTEVEGVTQIESV